MLDIGDKVVAAVSGGPDSVALLGTLIMLSREYNISLIAAHFNHGLRGRESDEEEVFVRRLCRAMGVTFESGYCDISALSEIKRGSLEDICRNERYKFLENVRKKHNADKIALGHNLNDQAETVVMKFLRGSGTAGLRGILPVRDEIYIRPLVAVNREEILKFLKKEELDYVVDSSNSENRYLRNRIRNTLIPLLKENYNPCLEETLGRMSEIIRVEDDYIKSKVEDILARWGIARHKGDITIKIPKLVKLHEALQRRVIQTLLQDCSQYDIISHSGRGGIGGFSAKPVGYLHVKSVMDMIAGGRPNCALDLPSGIEVKREYDQLRISKRQKGEQEFSDVSESGGFYHTVEIPGRVDIKESGIKADFDLIDKTPVIDFGAASCAFMDYEKISFPLIIRSIRTGDRIQPLGMKGTKKISAFLIDQKIQRNRRKRIPLLVDQESVLWIMGIRLSERARITGKTRKVVKIEIA